MNKYQLEGRHRQPKIRIRASADRFFDNSTPDSKNRIQNTDSDIGEGPEYDLEQEESYREVRKDFQNRREDGP